MEVASHQPDLPVHAEKDSASEVVRMLPPRTRLRILATIELDDGTLRALIVLDESMTNEGRQPRSPRGSSANVAPLGWATRMTADGEALIHLHARPFYVAEGLPLKVRSAFDELSTFVRKLPVGTRLYVVETRRTPSGKHRVCVVVFGDDELAGWVML